MAEANIKPPESVTLLVCNKGHIERGSTPGVCWACFPGGRRTWERGNPKQTEPNQRAFTYRLWGTATPRQGETLMSNTCNEFMVEQERMALRQADAALEEAQRVVDEQRDRLRRREAAFPRKEQS